MSGPQLPAAAEPLAPATSALFESMPLLGLLLAFDTQWRWFRALHRRNDELAKLHELYRDLSAEIHRLGLVEQFTARHGFKGDAKAAFARCLELAIGAGLEWPDIVEIVNHAGETRR